MFDFLFDWTSEFNTNIEIIDTHHKQFFKIGRDIEQLIQIECIGVTVKQLLDIVRDLREFASYHFYEEEKLMSDCGFPELDTHRGRHCYYAGKIAEIDLPVLYTEPMLELKKIREILQEMTFSHMLTDDKKMAEFIIKNKEEILEPYTTEKVNEIDEMEVRYGVKICELSVSNAYLLREQQLPGRCVLIFKEKRKNFERLPVLERDLFLADMVRLQKALNEVFHPDSFNFGVLGDVEEQIHYHIVPKYRDKVFWNDSFPAPGREDGTDKMILGQSDLEKRAESIRLVLKNSVY